MSKKIVGKSNRLMTLTVIFINRVSNESTIKRSNYSKIECEGKFIVKKLLLLYTFLNLYHKNQ